MASASATASLVDVPTASTTAPTERETIRPSSNVDDDLRDPPKQGMQSSYTAPVMQQGQYSDSDVRHLDSFINAGWSRVASVRNPRT